MADSIKLKDQASEFVRIMATPGSDTSDAVLARKLGVSPSTIRNWKRRPELMRRAERTSRDSSESRITEVWNALLEKATDGDVQAARLVFQLRGELDKKEEPVETPPPRVSISFTTGTSERNGADQ